MIDALNTSLRKLPAWTLYIVAPLPAAFWLWQGATGASGPEPIKALEHSLGEFALQLLIVGLAVTPLRKWTGLNLLKFRRAIGVVSFFYVLLHFLTWLVLDMSLLWGQILGDIVKRPYITIGFIGFVLLIPLAVTSNNASVRKLGARWRKLHKLVYPAVLLGGLHWVWLAKGWQVEPLLYMGAILAILALRVIPKPRKRALVA
ncbi:protein-methionine-sulfoxide reductase heme-binding subunit MsrQ [Vannielia litorea]|uniref:protein-methionine-sulfoxide reductase heme-binding subunit MsrQ n=1 Tax=Vannielia litorea TaxID=1217970 RepID=UPI001C948782|nr:protein-methionine-sulfoxide reductase heme-binding subunit MsrQ [Vannielia litorea]MBY6049821.1 protein-methionine-sulfoxide reductase heme-binding subunit MsrQ [Vannielia litorea]MBY6077235.1 protein-methionine-sulfoxide reductase heme-binding subunit MsrQ [Vannielia litorea]